MARKPLPKNNRSALVTGNVRFLGGGDARSTEGRHFATLEDDLIAERGGRTALDTVKREAVRAYAMLAVMRAKLETKLAEGHRVDPEEFGQIGDRMARQSRLMGPPVKTAPANDPATFFRGRRGKGNS